MDRLPHSYGLETLRRDETALRTALELAQSEQAKAVREAAEAIRVAAAERVLQIQHEMAPATLVAAAALHIGREVIAAMRAAADPALKIGREMAEATRAAVELNLQFQRETIAAMRAAAEPALQIGHEMAEAMRAAVELNLQLQRETIAAIQAAAEPALQIQRDMAEAASTAAELDLQFQREMAEATRAAAERFPQIQREIAEAERQERCRCGLSVLGIVGIAVREALAREAVARAIRIARIALERLQRCSAYVVQIRRLLLLTKNRILALLRQLGRSSFPANLILIQKSWFLTHGEHPPKLSAAAIPVCC